MEEKIIPIENKASYGISWYEHGIPYYGSHRGMRFRIARDPMEDVALKPPDKKGEALFQVIIWPEPYSFDATPEEQKTVETFPFDEAGKKQLVEWLNAQYAARYEDWEKVRAKHR